VAEVDLAALRKNVDVLTALLGPEVGVLAVVKADAYGHGAVPCARALERKVWGFGVSLVEEGIELRRGGVDAPVVVLGSFYGLQHRDVVAYRLTPVVSDAADLPRFERAAEDLERPQEGPRKVQVHLKIDTGMSRLGLRPEALPGFLEAFGRHPRLELTGLCTHLAEADGEDPAPTAAQLETFARAREVVRAAGYRPSLTHAANSAAALRFSASRFELVRAGLALYGDSPSRFAAFQGLTPVLRLTSRVVAIREVPAHTRVSYAGLYETPAPARIATVPIGYADGYSRRLSGSAEVLVAGRRCKVLGAITMDMCMVDVTAAGAEVGDPVVLLGAQGQERITAEELARWSGTIPWEIFCGISKRVLRTYSRERP
jgi:alanine racemase